VAVNSTACSRFFLPSRSATCAMLQRLDRAGQIMYSLMDAAGE
jgi:hypothetical protein